MELLYNVPPELEPYLEFIPPEELRKVITAALEQSVRFRSTSYEGAPEPDKTQETLLLKIQEMLASLPTAPVAAASALPPRPVTAPTPIQPAPRPSIDVAMDEESSAVADFLADILK